jgi:competence protein ComEC
MKRSYVTPLTALCVALFACVFAFRARAEWDRIDRVPVGAYTGLATLVGDPETRGAGVSVVFRVDKWRYEAVFYGADAWRVRNHMQGESVLLSATRERFGATTPRYKLVRHVAGRLVDAELGGDWTQGSALTRATNRLRRLIARGASALPQTEGSLLVGLVIGDDRAQPRELRESFREAGLSHLTAVSGQNIVFVLAVFAPVITRMRPRGRLVSTLGVLGAFTLMTRAEPSVLRAAGMAGVSALVFAAGGRATAGRILIGSSALLMLADPFLAWSVGFWLSFSATAGLIVVGPRCESLLRRMRCPDLVVTPLAASISAQLATLPILFFVFGSIAPWGLVANLLAVPVSGAVMLTGLPLCLAAGLVGGSIAAVLSAPLLLGVRWVWWVAAIVERLPG